MDLQNARSGFSAYGRFFVVDDNGLWRATVQGGAASAPVLIAPGFGNYNVSYTAVGGEVFACDGSRTICVRSDGNASFWGLTPPQPPAVRAVDGALPPGRYLVALTCLAEDVESGARLSVPIDLPDGGGIELTGLHAPPEAELLSVYVTDQNGDDLFHAFDMPVDVPSVQIVSRAASTDVLDRMGMWHPPENANRVQAFKGRLLVAAGKALFWSQPLAYHLFKRSTDLQVFPAPILMLAPLADGFYVATADRLTHWVSGDDPDTWRPRVVDDRIVAEGDPVFVAGDKIVPLETTELVALWATDAGVTIGMPGGRVFHPTRDTLALDANRFASLAFQERQGLSQVFTNFRQKTAGSAFAVSDRAWCDVVKAK